MNLLSKKIASYDKCQTSTGLKGCMEQLRQRGKRQQQHSTLLAVALALHPPSHTATSHLPLPPVIASMCHFTPSTHFALTVPFLRWGKVANVLFEEKNKKISNVIIVKQSCIAFQISFIIVTFSFSGQKKLGKKP